MVLISEWCGYYRDRLLFLDQAGVSSTRKKIYFLPVLVYTTCGGPRARHGVCVGVISNVICWVRPRMWNPLTKLVIHTHDRKPSPTRPPSLHKFTALEKYVLRALFPRSEERPAVNAPNTSSAERFLTPFWTTNSLTSTSKVACGGFPAWSRQADNINLRRRAAEVVVWLYRKLDDGAKLPPKTIPTTAVYTWLSSEESGQMRFLPLEFCQSPLEVEIGYWGSRWSSL